MERSTRGRPRSEASRSAILEAAFAELCERGYDKLSIEAVAARASVGKTTIYRWWRGKADLSVEAFFANTRAALQFPDTGSAREDFTQQVLQLAKLLRGSAGAALAGMMASASRDTELRGAIATRWVAPRRAWGVQRLELAREQGQTRADLDIDAALDLFYGPLYARLVTGQGVPSDRAIRAYLELAMTAVFATRRANQ